MLASEHNTSPADYRNMGRNSVQSPERRIKPSFVAERVARGSLDRLPDPGGQGLRAGELAERRNKLRRGQNRSGR
jgi:hypothetical protein